MKKLKIIFFGMGSIGQRYARLMSSHYNFSLFAFRTFKGLGIKNSGVAEIYSWKEIKDLNADVAFITNPTSEHLRTAIRCAEIGLDLFIEKPLSHNENGLERLLCLVKKNKITAYVAYCLRFHPVIQYLKKIIEREVPMHATVRSSSYLPNWRKDEDYRKSYSVKSAGGGGVVLDLSHEIDYGSYLFGEIERIEGTYGKLSELTVDSEDFADMFIKYKKCRVNMHLDLFSRKEERFISIALKNGHYIIGDLINSRVSYIKDNRERIRSFAKDKDVMYKKQLKYFLDNVHKGYMMNNIYEAQNIFHKIITFKKEGLYEKR